jgi:hypothetical protein
MNALHQDISDRIYNGEIYDTIVTHIQNEYGLSREVAENWVMDIEADITMQQETEYFEARMR